MILNHILTRIWGPVPSTPLPGPLDVTPMPSNVGVFTVETEDKTLISSQCPEFYSKDSLILLQAIYLSLLWLALIFFLNPSVSFGNFTKRYLKPCWWLIINFMLIWVFIPHHLETASYYPAISVTLRLSEGVAEKSS